jgi:serine/threonine protein kinase
MEHGSRPSKRRRLVFSEFDPEDTPSASAEEPVRYLVREVLHETRMSRVLRATDTVLERGVVLKVKSPQAPRESFLRERILQASLKHPGLLPVLDAGETEEGDPFYVLPLLEGQDLAEIEVETLPLRRRVEVVKEIADVLAYLHRRNIVHGDLSARNVRIGRQQEVYLLDLGLAHHAGEDSLRGGTQGYCAPEGGPATLQSDVWALGALLSCAVTGRVEDIPEDQPLASLVQRAQEREPARRPTSSEVAQELGRWLAGEMLVLHPYGPLARLEHGLRRDPAIWVIRGLTLMMLVLLTILCAELS